MGLFSTQFFKQINQCNEPNLRVKRNTPDLEPEKAVESLSEWAILIGEQTIIPVSQYFHYNKNTKGRKTTILYSKASTTHVNETLTLRFAQDSHLSRQVGQLS